MNAVPSRGFDSSSDLAEAERFLMSLDPDTQAWTFQTFDDNKRRKDPKLARQLHGSLREHAKVLSELQARGAGVFVTVNETNLQGRKEEHVVRVRAVFADFDGAPLENAQRLKLRPHIVVESSKERWHVYYRTVGVPLDRFSSIQMALSSCFESDGAVKDLPRVMRLPGFWHLKDEPFRTRLVDVSDGRAYGLPDLPRQMSSQSGPYAPKASSAEASSGTVVPLPGSAQLQRALELGRAAARRSHAEPAEGRHSMAVYLGWDCKREMLSEEAFSLAARTFASECRTENSDGEHDPFSEKRALEAVHHALRSNKDPGPPAKKPSASQVDQLVKVAATAEIWRTDQITYYATVVENGRTEHMPTNSQGFRRWLTREYIKSTRAFSV